MIFHRKPNGIAETTRGGSRDVSDSELSPESLSWVRHPKGLAPVTYHRSLADNNAGGGTERADGVRIREDREPPNGGGSKDIRIREVSDEGRPHHQPKMRLSQRSRITEG